METRSSPCIAAPLLQHSPHVCRVDVCWAMQSVIALFAIGMKTERLTHSRWSIPRADGYQSARARSAEIVVHRRAMQYAKYYDKKNSGSRITHRARLDVLIDEPCVKTYEGKCVNNAELFLRARCTCLECDACEATSGCS